MAFNEELADRIRERLSRHRSIKEKLLFGGIGFFLNGNMLVCVWQESLIVRLGVGTEDKVFLEPHVRKFDVTGKPMKGWIMVGPEGVEDDDQLNNWIERALTFVRKLPGK
ncbi:MAG: TfoX/Sxy family protein [Planctomycetes bacterium]|nr:TfoX/Sxy family protein [Planctomycetota bacterium]